MNSSTGALLLFLVLGDAPAPAWELPPPSKNLPRQFYLPGILQGPGENSNLDKGHHLKSCVLQLAALYGAGDTAAKFLDANMVGRIQDLGPFCRAAHMQIYRLEKCQALSAGVFISLGIPLLLEHQKANTSSLQWYALLYKFSRQKDPSPPLGAETELLFLAHNYKNGLNLARYREREVINGVRVEVFPDFLDLMEPEKLVFPNTYFEVVSDRYEESRRQPTMITYTDVYLMLPASARVKSVESLLNATLGGRDFSYKLPKFTRLF
jgi:hypothetical protein